MAKDRLLEITKQIADESKRLATTRALLQKAKVSGAAPPVAAGASSASIKSFFDAAAGGAKESSGSAKKAAAANVPSGRPLVNIVSEDLYPELCKLLHAAGPDGITKVVTSFLANRPLISKRQVEIKIFEMAVKEKRAEDTYKVWHIRDEFLKYLHMADGSAAAKTPKKEKAAKPEKEAAAPKSAAKSTPKRKRDEEAAASSSSAKEGGGANSKEPKKFKRAFGFFVKAKRAEAEETLGENASVRYCYCCALSHFHQLTLLCGAENGRAAGPAHEDVGGGRPGRAQGLRRQGAGGPRQVSAPAAALVSNWWRDLFCSHSGTRKRWRSTRSPRPPPPAAPRRARPETMIERVVRAVSVVAVAVAGERWGGARKNICGLLICCVVA